MVVKLVEVVFASRLIALRACAAHKSLWIFHSQRPKSVNPVGTPPCSKATFDFGRFAPLCFKIRKAHKARSFLDMAKGVQAFRANEIKRAVEALQKSGIKIARVSFGDGRFEIITANIPTLR
jgi:hypothetical protein